MWCLTIQYVLHPRVFDGFANSQGAGRPTNKTKNERQRQMNNRFDF